MCSYSFTVSTGLLVEVENHGIIKVGNNLPHPQGQPPPPCWVLSPLFSATALKQPRDGGPIPKLPCKAIFSKVFPKNTHCKHMEGLTGAVLGIPMALGPKGAEVQTERPGALGLPWCLLSFGSLTELSLAMLAAVKSATGALRILHAKLLS